jgi:hypothetical protein
MTIGPRIVRLEDLGDCAGIHTVTMSIWNDILGPQTECVWACRDDERAQTGGQLVDDASVDLTLRVMDGAGTPVFSPDQLEFWQLITRYTLHGEIHRWSSAQEAGGDVLPSLLRVKTLHFPEDGAPHWIF